MFINDILIYSRDEKENTLYLRVVLEVLRQHRLCAKFTKCYFWRKEIRFLGHVVSEHGISVYPRNVVAVQDWRVSSTMTVVHSFLGLVGYYRNFIQNFSKVSTPTTPEMRFRHGSGPWLINFATAQNRAKIDSGKIFATAQSRGKIVLCHGS